MTVDEAIEIKERRGRDLYATDMLLLLEADRLSIEALKERQFIRTHYRHLAIEPLPGETE